MRYWGIARDRLDKVRFVINTPTLPYAGRGLALNRRVAY
jgi:hypothetical protein